MSSEKTSTFSNGLIWFGAAVSIAEILTGTFIAPLGFWRGLAAILLGHAIGCTLLYFAGIIGANTQKSSMETVKISFGQKGSLVFSVSNMLQLTGWTAVMIVSGAAAADSVVRLGGQWVWSTIICLLIIVWVMVGLDNLGKINTVAMSALFLLTLVLSFIIFGRNTAAPPTGGLSFGAAVELSVAMPLSWLPLISDYTRSAKKPKQAAFVSAAVYFLVSCWMYVIGLGAALFTGESDVVAIMLKAGLGLAALVIVVFSTVTTTFLDVYSAGVSSQSIVSGFNKKTVAIVVCIVGALLAVFTPITQYENFLYLIGSVFAPMVAILFVDYYFIKSDNSGKMMSITNLVLWAVGFGVYRVMLHVDTPMGSTLPVMVITAMLAIATHAVLKGHKNV